MAADETIETNGGGHSLHQRCALIRVRQVRGRRPCGIVTWDCSVILESGGATII